LSYTLEIAIDAKLFLALNSFLIRFQNHASFSVIATAYIGGTIPILIYRLQLSLYELLGRLHERKEHRQLQCPGL
jgi:hypothetical protein